MIQIYINSATVVRGWCDAIAGMLGPATPTALDPVDMDASPHGAIGSDEDELEAVGHLLLPAFDIAMVSQDGDAKH